MIWLITLLSSRNHRFHCVVLNDFCHYFLNCTYKCIALVNTSTSATSLLASLTGEEARRCSDSESDEVIEVSDDEIADDEAAEGFDQ